MLFVLNRLTNLWGSLNSFSNSFYDFYSYEIVLSSDIRNNEEWCTSKNGGLLHVISCEILHFVTSCMNQNKKRKQTPENEQCGLKIIVKVRFILIIIQGKPK